MTKSPLFLRLALRFLLPFLCGVAVTAGAMASPPQSAPTRPQLEATDVDAWLDGYLPFALRSGDIAGAAVVIVKDGKVVTQRGYGWADVAGRRPVDPEHTLFRVGSISKLMTWTAVMQQVEAGKLDLDRDVNAYLDFRIPPYQGKPVTLRQLMTHTAGFEQTAKDIIAVGNPPIPLDIYLKRWVVPRILPPGTTPAYSNWGAALAGYIVQRVSGVPFADYAEQRIFRPIGMTQATFRQPLPGAFVPMMSGGYHRASEPARGFEMIGPSPAGALSMTAADAARFMISQLDGGRGLLAPQTAAMMHAGPLDRVDPLSLIPPLNRARLGFLGNDVNGHTIIGHRGDTQLFHSTMQLFLDDHVGLFVTLNSDGRDGASMILLTEFLDDFADRYFPGRPTTTRVDAATAARHARMMAGLWQDSRRADTTFFAIAGLLGQTKVTVDADGHLVVPSLKDAGGAPIRWIETAPFVWQSASGHDQLAARVVDGKVVRWSAGWLAPVMVYDRVPAARSAAWIVPALGLSLGVLTLTLLYWPVAALVRRKYRAPIAIAGAALQAYRGVRILCLATLAVIVGWLALLMAMLSNFALFSARTDGWLLLLQIGGAIVFVGSVGMAAWNAWLTWRDGRGWARRLWSAAVLLATIVILYVTWSFGLLVIGTHY